MHSQRANIPPQGLDRGELTVGALSGPHNKVGALLWCRFNSCGFTWSEKSTQEKQTCGNKMNFSLCVNMSSFCSDSYMY